MFFDNKASISNWFNMETKENVKNALRSDRKKNRTFTEDIFRLLLKLNKTKCIFSGSMHKTRQIHLKFRYFSLSKRNEKFQNCLRSDRTKNRNVYKGNVFLNNKSKTNEMFLFSRWKKRNIDTCNLTEQKDRSSGVSIHRRIAHLQYHCTEG